MSTLDRLLLAAALALAAPAAHAQAQAGQPQAEAAKPADTIWRLPASPSATRIAGEDGTLSFPVYVPKANVPALRRFQLTYKAAISVMPEASWLTVEINGKTVGRVPVSAPNKSKVLSFDIPADLLVTGWNAVQVSVSQRHRVDCSINSTYELWTEIDPARSGLVGPRPEIASVEDLAAIPVSADGAVPIEMMLAKGAGLDNYSRAIRAAESVAIRGQFVHPVVGIDPAAQGVRLVVGTRPEIGARDDLPSMAFVQPVEVLPGDGAAPPVVVVSGASETDLDEALNALSNGEKPVGSAEGLSALARAKGLRIRPGEPLTLAEAGIPTTAFSGRLFRAGFDLLLPPDAYLGDYGEALLSFDGGYSAGLTRDAALLVRVNGVTAGVLKLDRPGGAALQNLIVHMPLHTFRPGRNRVDIEAQLPAKTDEECDTLTSIGAKERFLVLGSSTLTLPRLARIAQFPGLSASFVGGFRVARAKAPTVYMPRATPDMAAMAATLLANAAAQTGLPTGARLARERPTEEDGSTLVIGTAADIPGALLAAGGLDPSAVEKAWRSGVTPAAKPADVTGAFDPPASQDDAGRLDAWGDSVEESGGLAGTAASSWAWLSRMANELLVAAGIVERPPNKVSINADTGFVVSQGFLGATPVTLAVGPSDEAMRAGIEALTRPSQLSVLDGRAAAFSEDSDGAQMVAAQDTRFFRTQPFSIDNTRLIAAGWLSGHAGWYIGAVLIVIFFLGASTWGALAFSRKKG